MATSSTLTSSTLFVWPFETELGWLALVGDGRRVTQLVFGCRSRQHALDSLPKAVREQARVVNWNPALAERLASYATGAPEDFGDVELDLDHLSPFQQKVVKHCRAIAYGTSVSYGELAARAGAPRAARAVGNTMAGNRQPLFVPCHRVTKSGGDPGGYSGPAGRRMKLRLLEMEGRAQTLPQATPKRGSARSKPSRKKARVRSR